MYHLRLIKALSYNGIISATKKHPDVYTNDKAIVDKAVASGYFAIVTEVDVPHIEIIPPKQEPTKDQNSIVGEIPDYETMSKQTKAELNQYAQAHGISTDGCKTKADILEVISAAYGGSHTMMELQKEI